MKYLFLIYIFCFQYVFSQNILVSSGNSIVMFRQHENPFNVFIEGVKCHKINITSNWGKIEKKGNCEFNIDLYSCLYNEIVIFVWKKGKLIDSTIVEVKNIFDPYVDVVCDDCYKYDFRTYYGKAIPKKGISLDYLQSQYKFNFKIVSFKVLVKLNGEIEEIMNIGENFTPKTLSLLSKVKVGDIIFFDNIKVIDPNGAKRFISGFKYEITDY